MCPVDSSSKLPLSLLRSKVSRKRRCLSLFISTMKQMDSSHGTPFTCFRSPFPSSLFTIEQFSSAYLFQRQNFTGAVLSASFSKTQFTGLPQLQRETGEPIDALYLPAAERTLPVAEIG